jgi:hypothetical protein
MENRHRTVKPISEYFRESVKFYDMDKPEVAQTVFVLLLAVIFGGYLLARPYILDLYTYYEQIYVKLQGNLSLDKLNSTVFAPDIYNALAQSFLRAFLIIFSIRAVSFLVSMFYGSWYYFSKTSPEMSGMKRTSVFFSRLPKLIIFNIIFYLAYCVVSIVLLLFFVIATAFVPVLYVITALLPLGFMIVNILFVFKDLLIIEFDVGVFRNFKKALDLTRGNRKLIIMNMMCVYALEWLLSLFSIDINNAVLALFISAFIECIILLISQRLTALMFIDAAALERKDLKPSKYEADA